MCSYGGIICFCHIRHSFHYTVEQVFTFLFFLVKTGNLPWISTKGLNIICSVRKFITKYAIHLIWIDYCGCC